MCAFRQGSSLAAMKFKSVLLFLLLALTTAAQQPHQVAVLVNQNSQASKKVANLFAALHGVPTSNLIYLDLPATMFSGRFECTPEEFQEYIYEPAGMTLEDRNLDEQILAWVYSVDFPIRIVTADYDRQQMSIMGLTFLYGKVPNLEEVENGKIVSPLFAGPGPVGGQKFPPRTFDIWSAGLKEKMPLPSMMLGYIGENGNSLETVLRCIEDGVKARQRTAGPRVLFVETDDKARSEPREWQFEGVKSELPAYAGTAVITTNTAPRQKDLTGVMTGAADVNPANYGSFLPGAMAEHLTSFSAEFQKEQSKCTEWLDAGATVTAGMVVEPYNNWVKFPHARFFAHYAAGCTAMESFYQSIASPVQVLLLGNPLAQIAVLPAQIKPIGLSKEITSDLDAAFVTEAKFAVKAQVIYSALLDGKIIKQGEGNSLIELPFDQMSDGYHEVRLIAQAVIPGKQVLPASFKDVPVFINKKGRSIAITGINDDDPAKINVLAEAGGEEVPESVYICWNGRELVRFRAGEPLSFEEQIVGEGPQRIQAVAVYSDGMEVCSEPAVFAIEFDPTDH